MAQSLSNVLLHIVFSTKHRQSFIDDAIEPELHAYLATACKSMKCPSQKIGGTNDHVHIACSLGRTVSISRLVQEIKQDSSKWIKSKAPSYQAFSWQNGYGTFSIGQSQRKHLIHYISNQREHHLQMSFQEEFRRFLRCYEIPYDEQYLWD